MTDARQEQPPVQIGDVVYVATAYSYADVRVPCPVCFGKLSVTLILGNGEHVSTPCDGCGLGYNGPQGTILTHGPRSSVKPLHVRGIQLDYDGWRVQNGSHGSHRWGVDAFATEAEAEARRAILHVEAERDAERRFTDFKNSKQRSHTWHVRYHREQIKDAEQRLAYHRAKLTELKPAPQ